jgi:hypothetical protein
MKTAFRLLTIVAFAGCNPSSTPDVAGRHNSGTDTAASTHVNDRPAAVSSSLVTLADAEKILGEPASLTDSATSAGKDVFTYSCAYTANAKDPKSEKTGNVYFLIQRYERLPSAQNRYTSTRKANENHGIEDLAGVGDEAYFHTDKENFYFVMVRKGATVLTMKVNKITSTTSLDAFHSVARKITDAL